MKAQEKDMLMAFVELLFPKEMLDYFEFIKFDQDPEMITIYLDERDDLRDKKPGHTYTKNVILQS